MMVLEYIWSFLCHLLLATGVELQKEPIEVDNNRKIFYIGDNPEEDESNKQIEQFYETVDKGNKDTVDCEKKWRDWLKDSAFYKVSHIIFHCNIHF